jgi:hypothetical protein
MHLRSLNRFEFDSVLFPYNYSMMQNPAYRADVDSLLRLCAERNVAVQTIKSIARRRWAEQPTPRFSWYEPIDDPEAIARAVHYVLGRSQLFLNTSSDARLLAAAIDAASSGNAQAPSDEQMEADVVRLGITPLFDGAELERI